jgi:hypothetical protein
MNNLYIKSGIVVFGILLLLAVGIFILQFLLHVSKILFIAAIFAGIVWLYRFVLRNFKTEERRKKNESK